MTTINFRYIQSNNFFYNTERKKKSINSLKWSILNIHGKQSTGKPPAHTHKNVDVLVNFLLLVRIPIHVVSGSLHTFVCYADGNLHLN